MYKIITKEYVRFDALMKNKITVASYKNIILIDALHLQNLTISIEDGCMVCAFILSNLSISNCIGLSIYKVIITSTG